MMKKSVILIGLISLMVNTIILADQTTSCPTVKTIHSILENHQQSMLGGQAKAVSWTLYPIPPNEDLSHLAFYNTIIHDGRVDCSYIVDENPSILIGVHNDTVKIKTPVTQYSPHYVQDKADPLVGCTNTSGNPDNEKFCQLTIQ